MSNSFCTFTCRLKILHSSIPNCSEMLLLSSKHKQLRKEKRKRRKYPWYKLFSPLCFKGRSQGIDMFFLSSFLQKNTNSRYVKFHFWRLLLFTQSKIYLAQMLRTPSKKEEFLCWIISATSVCDSFKDSLFLEVHEPRVCGWVSLSKWNRHSEQLLSMPRTREQDFIFVMLSKGQLSSLSWLWIKHAYKHTQDVP